MPQWVKINRKRRSNTYRDSKGEEDTMELNRYFQTLDTKWKTYESDQEKVVNPSNLVASRILGWQ